MTEVELRFAVLRVLPEHGTVETRFPDGRVSIGARDLQAPENRETATDLGYTDSADGVFRSLVTHEALHSLLSDWLWQRPSRVLRHEAGAERHPYHSRIYEESIVLAFERLLNTGHESSALEAFRTSRLDELRSHARMWLAKVAA